ncbi:hypothetical protein AVEN_127081-1 [Araneus ventricosus]|uniref:Uncharacterized protein n=1 Tax=Araneus ventricosus TaxID=182803 RepID=A0A4Y2RJX4_ARAVE|nr:hypothetical protein AVEN_127081-1 [Araneus ventricosus]
MRDRCRLGGNVHGHPTSFSVRTDGESSLQLMKLGSIYPIPMLNLKFNILAVNKQARLDSVNHGASSQRRNGLDENVRQWCYQTTFVQPGAKINSKYYIQKILKPFLKDTYCRLYTNSDAVLH